MWKNLHIVKTKKMALGELNHALSRVCSTLSIAIFFVQTFSMESDNDNLNIEYLVVLKVHIEYHKLNYYFDFP